MSKLEAIKAIVTANPVDLVAAIVDIGDPFLIKLRLETAPERIPENLPLPVVSAAVLPMPASPTSKPRPGSSASQ